jgi:Sulfotransferase family
MTQYFAVSRQDEQWKQWFGVSPVFIVGCARSGTTLLRLMLTTHPEISVASEGAYIYRLRTNFSSYGELSNAENLQRLYRDIAPDIEFEKFLSPPTFEDLFNWCKFFDCSQRSIITFYGTWEARILGKRTLRWWGDNAPYHVFHLPYFCSLFPPCKVIFLVRDPRDVCASCRSSFGWSIPKTVGVWENAMMEALVAACSCLADSRFFQVQYEKLVMNPRRQLQEVCRFLGVEYTDVMLRYHESAAARALSKVDHHRNLVEPVFTNSIGKYRQALTEQETDTITAKLYSAMRCLNYLSEEEYRRISQAQLMKTAHPVR